MDQISFACTLCVEEVLYWISELHFYSHQWADNSTQFPRINSKLYIPTHRVEWHEISLTECPMSSVQIWIRVVLALSPKRSLSMHSTLNDTSTLNVPSALFKKNYMRKKEISRLHRMSKTNSCLQIRPNKISLLKFRGKKIPSWG